MPARASVKVFALVCMGLMAAEPAVAQRWNDRGDYQGGRYSRSGCLSSNEVNASIMQDGWYPEALVGQRRGGSILLMRVSQGRRKFIATVDGCTGQILHMRGLHRGE